GLARCLPGLVVVAAATAPRRPPAAEAAGSEPPSRRDQALRLGLVVRVKPAGAADWTDRAASTRRPTVPTRTPSATSAAHGHRTASSSSLRRPSSTPPWW